MTAPTGSIAAGPSSAQRWIGLAYGLLAFAGTWIFFACFIVFLAHSALQGDQLLATSKQHHFSPAWGALVDLALVAVFGLQHSGMARRTWKVWLASRIPPELERSTFVHAANLAGFALLAFWQPLPAVIWQTEGMLSNLFWLGFAAGWLLLLLAALSIDIWELLGVKQATHWFAGAAPPSLRLKRSWLYACVAHPMYIGVLLGLWMTPLMTADRLLLAAGFTIYIMIGMHLEERDLMARFGPRYKAWRSGAPLHVAFATYAPLGSSLADAYASILRKPLPREIRTSVVKLGGSPI
jgi:protein-S-isoprenylcysteine O-methyltransferase Ste14